MPSSNQNNISSAAIFVLLTVATIINLHSVTPFSIIPHVNKPIITKTKFTTSSSNTQLQMTEFQEVPNTFLTAFETFDGSTIADPVVVSSVFWSSLQTKIISVIIGQFLATIVFAGLTYLVSTQISQIGNYVTKNIFNGDTKEKVRDNVVQFTESVKSKA